jgi:endo-1,4-beta-mannosidase
MKNAIDYVIFQQKMIFTMKKHLIFTIKKYRDDPALSEDSLKDIQAQVKSQNKNVRFFVVFLAF